MMREPYVRLQALTRQWQGRGGVQNICLEVERGSFVSILGPSGCGKSTLLRLLAGLETPESGLVEIGGKDVTHAAPADRGLSMVFQSYALFPHLSVRENILFGMKVRKVRRADQMEKLENAVAMTGLEGLEHRKPGELSGGQRQRVALARAVVSGQSLCLMDEPLSNLDAKLRHTVRRDIKALQRKLGLTVVYVTHDQSEAMSLSDKVVLMNAGKIEQTGSPQELYQRPISPFVARFIGDPPMALLEAGLFEKGQGQLGIRIEHLVQVPLEKADLVAEVASSEYLGADTQVLLSHPGTEGLALLMPGHAEPKQGSQIGLHIPEEHRVLFAAQSGQEKKDPQQNCATPSDQTVVRNGRKVTPLQPVIDERNP